MEGLIGEEAHVQSLSFDAVDAARKVMLAANACLRIKTKRRLVNIVERRGGAAST